MERGILMVPNGQEEKLAAESKCRQLLSQVKVPGHLGADEQNSQWISPCSAPDFRILK